MPWPDLSPSRLITTIFGHEREVGTNRMEDAIRDIRSGLKTGRFVNEASISQGIVLRLLDELSWDKFDTTVVWPEYTLGGRRVDFALCHPGRRPVVFVEVKQPGQGIEAERQLFEYAFHQGVQLAVLTTGQEWHFFLPAERGDYNERRVYKLDLLERDIEECVTRLKRYLGHDEIASGRAIEDARAEYNSLARNRDIQRTLPQAWKKLVEDGDDLLIELLAEKTESLCGFRPDPDTVTDFLRRSVLAGGIFHEPIERGRAAVNAAPIPQIAPTARRLSTDASVSPMWFEMNGQRHVRRLARDILIDVFRQLHAADPTFLERYAARTTTGTKRPHIARTREALFPKSPNLADIPGHSKELAPGWWIDVNKGKRQMENTLRIACEVAGLRYGTDLVVHF
jgi:hypothetical protein